MLAYKASAQTAYDPVLTAGSLLVAIVATAFLFFNLAAPRLQVYP